MRKPLIFITFALVALTALAACTPTTYKETLSKQKADIVDYMNTSGYSYRIQKGAYVTTLYPGNSGAQVITKGDSLYIRYTEYVFASKKLGGVISTNDGFVAGSLGMETPAAHLQPFGIKLGTTDLIPGLEGALQFATRGETIRAILPFDAAYGDKWNGIIQPYTSIAFDIYVIDIVRQ